MAVTLRTATGAPLDAQMGTLTAAMSVMVSMPLKT